MKIDFSNVPLAPIATVVAALITSLIAFINLTLSKEQKTSDFRQAWIDGLRGDLAVFFSSARALCRVMQEARSPHRSDEDVLNFRFSKEQVGKMRFEGAEALYRVKLRLNPNEDEHAELNRLLDLATSTQNQINVEKGLDYSDALIAIENASSYSQEILKSEWKRVKRGEKSFRVAKNWIMPMIMAISLVFVSVLLYSPVETDQSIQSTADAPAN
ncbi:hypothetical protein K0I73_12810 [Shewanella mesophila]|uniref:hypothetical protein n=1 Tax=Shewanella mesophila TaxID=2864208 RepID=UPI001C6600E1|nr:hypothetical protein [Shewanella mesophila]QYJ85100.1 hypothetical protein K0I73_12810 [Shewanella mesophila]